MKGYKVLVERLNADRCDVNTLESIFGSFGDLANNDEVETAGQQGLQTGSVDYKRESHSAVVAFEEEGDALAAVDNMNGAKLFGQIVTARYLRPRVGNERQQGGDISSMTAGSRIVDVRQ